MKKLILIPALFILQNSPAFAVTGIYECLHGMIKNTYCTNILKNYWGHKDTIEQAAGRHNIPVSLLKAQIAYESGYNQNARSPVGAKGLSQIMPATAQYLGVSYSSLNNPYISLDAGARFMSQLYRDFGRWDLALAAYNAGPRRVKAAGYKIPNITETRDYVQNILRLELAFRTKGSSSSTPHSSSGLVKVSGNPNANDFIPPKRSERVNATLPVKTREGWEQGERLAQAHHGSAAKTSVASTGRKHKANTAVTKAVFQNTGSRNGYWNSGEVSLADGT